MYICDPLLLFKCMYDNKFHINVSLLDVTLASTTIAGVQASRCLLTNSGLHVLWKVWKEILWKALFQRQTRAYVTELRVPLVKTSD